MNPQALIITSAMFESLSFKALAAMDDFKITKLTDQLSNLLNIKISKESVEQWVKLHPFIDINGGIFNIKGHNYISTYGSPTVLISTTDKEPDDIKVLNEPELIKGLNEIPDLYKFVGKKIKVNEVVQNIPKNLAHYGFILYSLASLLKPAKFGLHFSPDLVDNDIAVSFENFILNNKDRIDKILSGASMVPNFIGHGVSGIVFDIGNNFILKLTRDKGSYDQAIKSLEQLHDYPEIAGTEAMTYDAGELGVAKFNDETYPIYFIILEKMNSVNSLDYYVESYMVTINRLVAENIRQTMDSLKKYLPIFKDLKANKSRLSEVMEDIRKYAADLANTIKNILDSNSLYEEKNVKFKEFSDENLKDNWLEKYIEEIIIKLLTQRGDLHLGNLGLTNHGEFRFFDPYHEDWTDDINIE